MASDRSTLHPEPDCPPAYTYLLGPAITEQGQTHAWYSTRYLQLAGRNLGDVMLDSPKRLQAMRITPSTSHSTAAANCFSGSRVQDTWAHLR